MGTIRGYVEGIMESLGFSDYWTTVSAHFVMVAIAVILSLVSYFVCRGLVLPFVRKLTIKTSIEWDEKVFNVRTMRAACKIVPAIVIWKLLPHIFYEYPVFEEVLRRLTAIYITVASTWLVITLIDSMKKLEGEHRTVVEQYFHTFCGVMKIIAIFISLIIIVAIAINRSPLTLFAGLGATSAILMLVFKDVISGLVAGVRLTSNDMLQKGDWITVEKAGINGIVEDITLTTVKVRNFDKTIVTITPQTLVDDTFQNWKGMQQGEGRRVARVVYIDFRSITIAGEALRKELISKGYFTEEEMKVAANVGSGGARKGASDGRKHPKAGRGPVNLTLFRNYMERYLSTHPAVNKDLYMMVRQFEATNTGLPIEFYFFLKEKEWVRYEHLLAGIMEYVYAVIPDFGLKVYQRYSDR
ncbi:mechanosensitive ion channel family protein [Xylanibacter muris]|uniref:Mechanosensitive ion channel n=1 Tax=Xylanibacter muris TaxID=2736290 RepID=A0ABX2AQ51_9BACT|nr:mechanosensitive ion channel domain-containing protein [Xylanibacter muris]NPD92152.1 mechanosensitive ion channel [Xylanibacter muris]